jgi:hypothetical protein
MKNPVRMPPDGVEDGSDANIISAILAHVK